MIRLTGAVAGRARGFTLIELMITVTVVAILASIAIPAYTSQIRKSRRTDAKTALLDLAGREERYLATNNHYTQTAADLGYGAFPSDVASGYYTINVVAALGDATKLPTFTATATPVGGQGQDKDADCQSFQVSSTGAQASQNQGGTDSSATCWK